MPSYCIIINSLEDLLVANDTEYLDTAAVLLEWLFKSCII